jgi:bacterial/archaeal transporter family protein
MPSWVALSLVALTCWGTGNFVRKQAITHISPWAVVVFQSVTVMLLAIGAVIIRGEVNVTTEAVLLAIAGGSFQFLANISMAFALTRGPASLVVPVSSMYPVMTLVLAFFILGETISATQALGLLLSVAALYAFSR